MAASSASHFTYYGRRVLGACACAEGTAYAHHRYAQRRANEAPPPPRMPREDDAEYAERFLEWARCVPGHSTSATCAQFVRHAFFGAAPEALPREAINTWLATHLHDVSGGRGQGSGAAVLAAQEALLEALGPRAPAAGAGGEPREAPFFAYREGPILAWYKPLALKAAMEGQRCMARWRLRSMGFVELEDSALPRARFWVRGAEGPAGEVPLLVLHGYGRGIAAPLFSEMLPDLGRQHVIIVECPWLMVTHIPVVEDITTTPSVREMAAGIADFLRRYRPQAAAPLRLDVLGHSFGATGSGAEAAVRRAVLLDPMCFMPGITKQAQLLRREPGDLAAELLQDLAPDAPGPELWEAVRDCIISRPDPCQPCGDDADDSRQRRRWVVFQAYFFNYFIYRDLMYSWVNARVLHGAEYLDRGHLRAMNRDGQLLTVLAETDLMIPAQLLREDLSAEVPRQGPGGVLWLPIVGHGACQHRDDVAHSIRTFLSAP